LNSVPPFPHGGYELVIHTRGPSGGHPRGAFLLAPPPSWGAALPCRYANGTPPPAAIAYSRVLPLSDA